MGLHSWLAAFGEEVPAGTVVDLPAAQAFARLVDGGRVHGAAFVAVRQDPRNVAVHIEVEVERPQDLAHPIKAVEPIAVVFPRAGGRPSVLALRDDFPDTPHQNSTPPNTPASLCIDDRPWAEARLTYSPMGLARQIQLWLAKAASGELHDRSLPPEPLFFPDPISIVLPSAALRETALIITEPAAPGERKRPGTVTVLRLRAQAQALTRMRHTPKSLAALAEELKRRGVDLLEDLKTHLLAWSSGDMRPRLASLLVMVVEFPVIDEGGKEAIEYRAFVTLQSAGEIGEKLGVLLKHKPPGNTAMVYVRAIPANKPDPGEIALQPAGIHLTFERGIAHEIAGIPGVDRRRVVLVGAGAIGSHIAMNLGREGRFRWSVVDNDALLPHNLARHALLPLDVGALKANALAEQLGAMLGEPCDGIVADVLAPGVEEERLAKALADAEIIVDASASIAVARHLSDQANSPARRVSTFFNPAGTASVVLTEPADRSITLHDLEAQYYRLLLTEKALAAHLQPPAAGVSYSGSCRALTNRIPATRASLLAALASRGIVDGLARPQGSIAISTLEETGAVTVVSRKAAAVHVHGGAWSVVYDDSLLADLRRLRAAGLPAETGGVLMGVVDTSRRTIHLAYAMPAPPDSKATTTGFERGVEGLLDATTRITQSTMYQLKYVGEWHSHPDRSSVLPSGTDLRQVAWLARELCDEGLPALMVIAGQHGEFSMIIDNTRVVLREQKDAA